MEIIEIRPFIQSDYDAVKRVIESVGWIEQYVVAQLENINNISHDKVGEVAVAVVSGKIVGFIQALHFSWNRLSQVHGLMVLKDYHRQGIARKLIEHVEDTAKKRGNRGIHLNTPVNNLIGRAFYTALQFSEKYIMIEYYEEGVDGVNYQKIFNK